MFRGRSNALAHLGLPPDATDANAKKAYKKMALQVHPNRPEGNEAMFKLLGAAMDLIEQTKYNTTPRPQPTPKYNTSPRPEPMSAGLGPRAILNANNVTTLASQLKNGFIKTQKSMNQVFSSLPGLGRKTKDGWVKPMRDTYPSFLRHYWFLNPNSNVAEYIYVDWKNAPSIHIKDFYISVNGCILKNSSFVLYNPTMFEVRMNDARNGSSIIIRTILPSKQGYPGLKVFIESPIRFTSPEDLKKLEALLVAVRIAYSPILDSFFRKGSKLPFVPASNLPRDAKDVIKAFNARL